MLRKWGSAAVAAAMLFSTTAAFAADTEQAALAPGNAAGVQKAQGIDNDTVMELLAAGVVIAAIILITTGTGNGNSSTATSSTSTGPT